MRILVVDDETEIAALVARGLSEAGHAVTTAPNGLEALSQALAQAFDVAVLDVMMPGMSGFELCRWLKERDEQMMVILLTARDAVDDRVRGLDEGADDYMVKPFALAELVARIRAIHRRDALTPQARISAGDIELSLFDHTAEVAGRSLQLSRTEFDLLHDLVRAEGQVVTRTQLFARVWGTSENINPNVLDQYVSYLRRKLVAKHAATRIETLRGVGYRLAEVARADAAQSQEM